MTAPCFCRMVIRPCVLPLWQPMSCSSSPKRSPRPGRRREPKQMATAAKKICNHPGCNQITSGRYCAEHTPQAYTEQAKAYDRRRGSAAARGYDGRWHKFAAAYLRQPGHQFCALHISPRCNIIAECVDHIRPLRGPSDPGRFDPANLQPACLACNTLKGDREMRGTYVYGDQEQRQGR